MSDRDGLPLIHVVAGGLIDAAGRVLIAQRPPGKHMAGCWEFPGGKVEPGEERRTALARELREELGVDIASTALRPLVRVRHAYPARDVLIDMWVVKQFVGEPRGLDGQALRWCPIEDLATADLLPADAPITAALRLPERLTHRSSPHFQIRSVASWTLEPPNAAAGGGGLRGALCVSPAEALDAAAVAANFIVMSVVLTEHELEGLCDASEVPVFARGISLERAWALGASGCNELTP